MIFESRAAKPPRQDRESLLRMIERMNSATTLQENKVQVLVMGSKNVGKTTMIGLFSQEKIVIEDEICTNHNDMSVEIIVELMEIEETLETKMRRFVIQTAHAYILMYSVEDPKSFLNISQIKDEIVKLKGPGMPVIVVGNKTDVSKRKVNIARNKQQERRLGDIPHIQVSLARRNHIDDVYKNLFEHPTLRKLTDIVSKINFCTLFKDLRRLSLQAETLEENVSRIFSDVTKAPNYCQSAQIDSPRVWKRLKNIFS